MIGNPKRFSEKMDSFWGFGGGGGWSPSGTKYSCGYHLVGPIGEYVWAIRLIDLDDNSTVFQTDFDISLSTM